jgi:hypothetical protein
VGREDQRRLDSLKRGVVSLGVFEDDASAPARRKQRVGLNGTR